MAKKIALKSLPASVQKQIRQGMALCEGFTGHQAQVEVVDSPAQPKVLLRVGYLEGVIYSAVRDGETQKYLHEFSESARPLLCVTPDGRQLFILGGGYDFTDCGIEDRVS